MTKTPWIAGTALAAALAVAGHAQPMPGDGPPAPPKTRAEVQARIAEHFKKADTNGDGVVTRAEADAAREAMKAKFAEHFAQMRDQHFAELDADKNGQISKEEFTAGHRGGKHGGADAKGGHGGMHGGHGRGRAMFMAMHGEWFERADANKDGKLTLAEAEAGPLAMFDKVDANKDGTISPEEGKAARDMMRAKWKEMHGAPDKG